MKIVKTISAIMALLLLSLNSNYVHGQSRTLKRPPASIVYQREGYNLCTMDISNHPDLTIPFLQTVNMDAKIDRYDLPTCDHSEKAIAVNAIQKTKSTFYQKTTRTQISQPPVLFVSDSGMAAMGTKGCDKILTEEKSSKRIPDIEELKRFHSSFEIFNSAPDSQSETDPVNGYGKDERDNAGMISLCPDYTIHPEKSDISYQDEPMEEDVHVREEIPLLKNQKEVDSYFSCYQKNRRFKDRYETMIKESIGKAVDHYMKMAPLNIQPEKQKIKTLFSCLIFRESMGWRNLESHTGAKGLGQFTTIAIEDIRKILSRNIESDEYQVEEKISVISMLLENTEINRPEYKQFNKQMSYYKKKRHINKRMKIMQNYWLDIDASLRPSVREIDSNYIFDISNHEIIVHLSMLMIINCQINYRNRQIGGLDRNPFKNFLACMGAYNMGVNGFYDNALKGVDPDATLEDWIDNLKKVNHFQKNETIRHMISINRCIQKNSNFPTCGTDINYCQGELPNTNICLDKEKNLLCSLHECR